MKTIFKTMSVAVAVLAAVSCGNNAGKANEEPKAQEQAAVEVVPSVAVQKVHVQDVVQDATYTSTVQAYVRIISFRRQQDVSHRSMWRSATE